MSKLNAATLVTTAEGEARLVTGFVSKLIVAHPRWSVAVTAVLAALLGHFV